MRDKAILKLSDSTDRGIVGGKASALASMLRAGFTVPNGFVLSANAFKTMTPELEAAVLDAFNELDADFVAVRSSAISEDGKDAAWAGQLDTFLNCTREDVISKITRCWQSADTERARSYALQKGLESTRVAVLVQEMIESDVSGVAFSAHPITGDKDQVVIEAALGLGEAVVSGQITPDTYIIDTENERLLEKHIGSQTSMLMRDADGKNIWQPLETAGDAQKLTDTQIITLGSLTRKLEAFFGYPIDMEWAYAKDTMYILQCRPITTLALK